MLNTDKNLKLYYSISEVARMFDVTNRCCVSGRRSFRSSDRRREAGGYANTVRKILKR